MQEEKLTNLKKAMEDSGFEQKIADCNSPEELFDVLEERQLGYSMDEVNEMYDVIANSLSDELNENALDNVSGGLGVLTAGAIVAGAYIAGRLYGRAARSKFTCRR